MNPASTRTAKASFWQVAFSLIFLLILTAALFFLSGDWRWTEGWIFSVIFIALSFATVIYLYLKDPALLNERFGSPVQKEQKLWDKLLLSGFIFGFLIWYAIIPLDAKRFGWSPQFPLWIKVVGAVLYLLNFIVMFSAFRENTFAAPVVKLQTGRGQRVISSGLYGIMRHPMYLGGALLLLGAPLLLGSTYGLATGLLMVVILVIRSIGEEEMLRRELEGYDQYMQEVRWRLIPFIF